MLQMCRSSWRLAQAIHWKSSCAIISPPTGQSAGVAAGSVVQIGALTIATYAVELLLERGFVFAFGTLLYQFLQGAPGFQHP